VCKQVIVCPGHIWTTLYTTRWFLTKIKTCECSIFLLNFGFFIRNDILWGSNLHIHCCKSDKSHRILIIYVFIFNFSSAVSNTDNVVLNSWMNNSWKCGSKCLWPNIRHCLSICVVVLRKTTENFSQVSSVPTLVLTGYLQTSLRCECRLVLDGPYYVDRQKFTVPLFVLKTYLSIFCQIVLNCCSCTIRIGNTSDVSWNSQQNPNSFKDVLSIHIILLPLL
jgi:hypothetical protein